MKFTEDKSVIYNAVNDYVNIVMASYGPNPRNVTFATSDQSFGGATINDGVQIVKSLPEEKEPLRRLALDRLRRACAATHSSAGDGTSTTALFFRAFLKALKKHDPNSEYGFTDKVGGLLNQVVEALERNKIEIDSREVLIDVVNTAMHGHEWAADLASVMWDLGPYGVLDIRNGSEMKVEFVEAIKWGAGLKHGNLDTNLTVEDAWLAVVAGTVSDLKNIDAIINFYVGGECKKAFAEGRSPKPLVLIAQHIEGSALRNLSPLTIQGPNGHYNPPFYLVGVPHVELQLDLLSDLAIASGGVLHDRMGANDPSSRNYNAAACLGNVKKMIIKGDSAAFVMEDQERANKYSERLIDLSKEEMDEEKKFQLEMRATNIKGKMGVFKVPISTMSHLQYVKEVLEDGYRTAQESLRTGIVHGGCVALGRAVLEVISQGSSPESDVLWEVVDEQMDALGIGKNDSVDEHIYDSLQAVKSALLNAYKEAQLIHDTKYFVWDE